MKGVALNRLLT